MTRPTVKRGRRVPPEEARARLHERALVVEWLKANASEIPGTLAARWFRDVAREIETGAHAPRLHGEADP